jgi:peptidoglycan/xylan/chitin deacetylase (PgdA/CDA1 family)
MNRKPILFLLLWLLMSSCGANAQVTSTPTFSPSPTPPSTSTPAPTLTAISTATLPPAVLITSGDWTHPDVALTFDLCQDPAYPAGYDASIVEVLQRYKVPATFFLGGDWMHTHREETKQLAANPDFELANHSWSHPDFTRLSEAEMVREIEVTEAILFQLTGRHSRFFRPPSGFYNDITLQVVAELGLYTILWDSVTGDPDPNFDAATILAEVQRTVKNGSIIIMHANGRGWHTAEALPSIIEYLDGRGFNLVTVSQLLGLEPPTEIE